MTTITFQCYACNQVLKVGSDKAGKKAKCIKCGTILTIPVESTEEPEVAEAEPAEASPPPVPRRRSSRDDDEAFEDDDRPRRRSARDEDEDDRPRRRSSRDEEDDEDRPRRRRDRDEEEDEDRPRRRRDEEDDDYDRPRKKSNPWPKVRVGMFINVFSAGALIGYGALELFIALFFMIAALGASAGMAKTSSVFVLIAAILFTVQEIPAIVGYVFAIFTPNKKGALALAITVLSLGGVSLVLKIIFYMVFYLGGGSTPFGGGDFRRLFGAAFGMPPGLEYETKAVAIIVITLILLAVFAEYIVYPLYLRSVCQQKKERYLEGGAFLPLGLAAGAVGLKVLLTIIGLAASEGAHGEAGGKAMLYIISFLKMGAAGLIITFGIVYLRYILAVRYQIE
jgi:hypothetical protein